VRKNTPKETASDELLQANLGMFGSKPAGNDKVDRLKRIAKQLKNGKKEPE